MASLPSLAKSVLLICFNLFVIYLWLHYGDRWSSGFKGLLFALFIFPLGMYSAMYVADRLTLGKLGDFGTTLVMVLVLLCVAMVYNTTQEKRRAAAYHDTAAALGLDYHKEVRLDPSLARNPLLQQGFMPSVQNGLAGKFRGTDTQIFNYSYEVQSGDSPDHHLRTAVVFRDPQAAFPDFHLRPKRIGDRIFRKKGVDFGKESSFSRRYRVTGRDADAIRRLFGPSQRKAFLEAKRRWAAGSADGYLVLYVDERMDEQVEPHLDYMKPYLEQAWSLYEALRSSALATPAASSD